MEIDELEVKQRLYHNLDEIGNSTNDNNILDIISKLKFLIEENTMRNTLHETNRYYDYTFMLSQDKYIKKMLNKMEVISCINMLCAFESIRVNEIQSAGIFAVEAILSSHKLPKESKNFMNAMEYIFATHPYGENIHYKKFIEILEKKGDDFFPLMTQSFSRRIFEAAKSNESALIIAQMIENIRLRLANPREKSNVEKKNSILETGRYSVVYDKILGEGGFSVVFLAKLAESDENSEDKLVAVKVIELRKEFTRSFLNEYNVAVLLLDDGSPHRNISRYTNADIIGPSRNYGLLEMEYLKGGTLEDRITIWKEVGWEPDDKWNSPGTISNLVGCFLEICRGMIFAHSKNVFHQDLKPDNIMFDEHNIPKIVDWGIGRIKGINRNKRYFANWNITPELVLSKENLDEVGTNEIDKYIDIFQLGLLFYYMLTYGKHPLLSNLDVGEELEVKDAFKEGFESDIDYSFLDKIKYGDLLKNVLKRAFSPRLAPLVKEKKKEETVLRYSNVSEMVSGLNEYVNRINKDRFETFQNTRLEQISQETKKFGNLSTRSLNDLQVSTNEKNDSPITLTIIAYRTHIEQYFENIISSYGSNSLNLLLSDIAIYKNSLKSLYDSSKDKRLSVILEVLTETEKIINILNKGHFLNKEADVKKLKDKLFSINV
jgi:serine/threonine protein kinase